MLQIRLPLVFPRHMWTYKAKLGQRRTYVAKSVEFKMNTFGLQKLLDSQDVRIPKAFGLFR